jgi:hypothetical protein
MSMRGDKYRQIVGEVLLWLILSGIIAATICYGRWAQ